MSSPPSSLYYTRIAMATPAIILFVVTCLAPFLGGNGGLLLVRGGSSSVRGSSVNVGDQEDARSTSSGEIMNDSDSISLEFHGRKRKSHSQGDASASNIANSNDKKFDFYAYSMSYQPEFCYHKDFVGCTNHEAAWEGQLTIHGLWPNRNDGTWPSTCSNEEFDISLLSGVEDKMAHRWPNVKALDRSAPGHTSFWAHEWSKHGTCSGLPQSDYFNTALDLLIPTPSAVLKNYGSSVKRSDLQGGEDGYGEGLMSVLVCKSGFLTEVRVCFEKMPDNAPGDRVDCPEIMMKEDSCGDDIKIASFASKSGAASAVE